MRAARLYGPRDIRLDEIPDPVPGPGQVLVRVRAVSICPSDWRLYVDGHAGGTRPERPFIQGHEFSGEVAALGPGAAGPPAGTRVAVEPSWHCGACDLCRRGLVNLCRRVAFPSFPPQDGALAEYIACPTSSLCPLPESVSDVEGALVEPLGVAIHATRLAHLDGEESVVVLGAGIIGLSVLRLCRVRGISHLAAVEPLEGRREWASRFGAGRVAASYQTLANELSEADAVFECSGEEGALDEALRLARPGGRVVVVGIPRSERAQLDISVARRRELTVVFARRSRDTLREAVGLVAGRQVALSSLPIRRFALDQTAAALEAAGARPADMLRAVVVP